MWRSAQPRGYDGGKKLTGRKRHLLTDTLSLLLVAVVGPADERDVDGGWTAVEEAAAAELLDRAGCL